MLNTHSSEIFSQPLGGIISAYIVSTSNLVVMPGVVSTLDKRASLEGLWSVNGIVSDPNFTLVKWDENYPSSLWVGSQETFSDYRYAMLWRLKFVVSGDALNI